MNKITVNGRSIIVPNGQISVINGDVFVNGQRYTDNENLKQVNIVIEGGCDSLQVDCCDRVEVKGDVRSVLESGGSVTVQGGVFNKINAGGSVTCGDVSGNIDAGGSVNCGNVSGSVDAGGSVIRR